MAATTNTERSRRRRAHLRGDHSLCRRPWCSDGPSTDRYPEPRPTVTVEAAAEVDLDRLDDAVAREADRMRGRLDWLEHQLATGEAGLDPLKVLSEARQQARALAALAGEVRRARQPEEISREDPLDELARQRAARIAAASGQ